MSRDAAAILPSQVTVVFPQVLACMQTGGWYPITIQLVDLNPEFQGNGGTKTFHDTAEALMVESDPTPTNYFTLLNLATKVATDYWNYLSSANLDIVYAGVPGSGQDVTNELRPEGLHDIQIDYKLDRMKTRIMRSAWNFEPEEMSHYQASSGNSSASSNSCSPGVCVVVQTTCDDGGLVVTRGLLQIINGNLVIDTTQC